jgi:hypothetical protein
MPKDEMENEANRKSERISGHDPLRLATLAGVFALMVLSFLILRLMDQISTGLNSRLSKIEKQLEDIGGKPDTAAVKTAPRRGPDPSRVYTINTAGAPTKGSPAAKVTIAEFSDFQ